MIKDIQNNRTYMNRKVIEAYKQWKDRGCPTGLEKGVEALTDVSNLLEALAESFIRMGDVIEAQQEEISRLSKELYELAPDKETIDATYLDDEQARTEAIEQYMNHGEWGK